MKKIQISIGLVALVFMSASLCVGQEKPKSPSRLKAEKSQSDKKAVSCREGWQWVRRDQVAFCLPTAFSVKQVISLDQSYLWLTNTDLEIAVFTGPRTPTLVSDSTLTDYTRNFCQIGKYPAIIVSYREKDRDYVRSVKIDFVDDNGLRTIVLFSASFRSEESSIIFDKVLRTITIGD